MKRRYHIGRIDHSFFDQADICLLFQIFESRDLSTFIKNLEEKKYPNADQTLRVFTGISVVSRSSRKYTIPTVYLISTLKWPRLPKQVFKRATRIVSYIGTGEPSVQRVL